METPLPYSEAGWLIKPHVINPLEAAQHLRSWLLIPTSYPIVLGSLMGRRYIDIIRKFSENFGLLFAKPRTEATTTGNGLD